MSVSSHSSRPTPVALALIIALLLSCTTTTVALALVSTDTLQLLSKDPYTNKSSQHKTQVEPDTFSFGSTIVSAFQSGRFFTGGASNAGWATSNDNGANWQDGFLPGTTVYATPPGKYDRVSDPSVAYDARHNTWLISTLAIIGTRGAGIIVNQSTGGGLTWANPVTVATTNSNYDKDWIVCDNTTSSPFYGHCYIEWDDAAHHDLVLMSSSSDGGNTWGTPTATKDNVHGIGGQPLVQTNGTVIVAFRRKAIEAFSSSDGGASWGNTVTISNVIAHPVAGNMRADVFPSAEIDGAGTIYVTWQDCRFEMNCSANDIVLSTSSDGTHWSAVQRVPTDPVNSGVDHFIPGIGVDKSTAGNSAHIALTYYYFPVANCGSNCQLEVGYISSVDGGTTWSSSQQLAGPMNPTWLANTNQGRMVGDYISTSIVANGQAFPVFAVATAPNGSIFNEAMYTARGGLPVICATTMPVVRAIAAGYMV